MNTNYGNIIFRPSREMVGFVYARKFIGVYSLSLYVPKEVLDSLEKQDAILHINNLISMVLDEYAEIPRLKVISHIKSTDLDEETLTINLQGDWIKSGKNHSYLVRITPMDPDDMEG